VLWLVGDVMTGRGVDQILPTPGAPALRERHVDDARTYVKLAEKVNGRIPKPVDFAWPWGDALRAVDEASPDVRLINLETSITRSDEYEPGKGVHYRMHPSNVGCLTVARPDACALANNHVRDFGVAGLRPVGAGRNADEAWRPVSLSVGEQRILIWSVAVESSGVPASWAAGENRAGIAFLPDLSEASTARLTDRVSHARQPGDLVEVSIHWGSNWGYGVPQSQVRFAHRLIDAGVDVIHGHSSHHPRSVEVYRGKLVLYGCGDLIDDYEGISGYEAYRDDLRLMYFVSINRDTREVEALRLLPMQARQLRLHRASPADAAWVCEVLTNISESYGTRFGLDADGFLVLRRLD
jgi:poly-gamma-glutamate synthesis protein (capsule biosynthesis protein)